MLRVNAGLGPEGGSVQLWPRARGSACRAPCAMGPALLGTFVLEQMLTLSAVLGAAVRLLGMLRDACGASQQRPGVLEEVLR